MGSAPQKNYKVQIQTSLQFLGYFTKSMCDCLDFFFFSQCFLKIALMLFMIINLLLLNLSF